jgi:hypothetical protein
MAALNPISTIHTTISPTTLGQIYSNRKERRLEGRRSQARQDAPNWTSDLCEERELRSTFNTEDLISGTTLLKEPSQTSKDTLEDSKHTQYVPLGTDEIVAPMRTSKDWQTAIATDHTMAILQRPEARNLCNAIEQREPGAVLSLLIRSKEALQIFATLVSAGLIATKDDIFILTPQANEYRQEIFKEKNASAVPLLETQTSQWLMQHLSELQERFAGQWVAIVENRVALSAATLPELLQRIREASIHRPFITQIPTGPILWDTAYAG